MFTEEGTCDWCKKPSFVTRHDYVDGKYHSSCKACYDIAKIDVRLFNQGELQMRERMAQRAS
ncbi:MULTISPECIES: hypothetical protein [Vibrio]|jgi:uncharacterized protein with FMN-binding domain|uniref:Uncharacterized protein n=2 Tax=Vibrio campbellii TaxID=680 RepID=A0AAQ2XW53_9VIBR|nr:MULTISPECIES: hypothetical protein [Vibrio]EDL67896.1 conserved hypothetical protein [Vibrio campbellii HY01]APX06486.1 hypothetical protein BWP24_10070 [Vibrio campbellii]AQM67203.1 hypothetical protein Vca1114GL_00682 [Vibrio campbellii]ARR06673.1 hypothetical protein Vc3S01_1911 [Vibrio campbellii]ARR44733.1 hypothetical protein CAY59_10445 [Vibrio campbellii]